MSPWAIPQEHRHSLTKGGLPLKQPLLLNGLLTQRRYGAPYLGALFIQVIGLACLLWLGQRQPESGSARPGTWVERDSGTARGDGNLIGHH